MSAFRWLFSSTSSPTVQPALNPVTPPQIEVLVHLPSYGFVICSPPSIPPQAPQEYTFSGEIEVRVPLETGRIRCRGIRLILRAWCRLDIGPGRKNMQEGEDVMGLGEEDVLDDQIFPLAGETILEPGSQRFDFSLTCSTPPIASDSTVTGIQVLHYIFAQFVGARSTSSTHQDGSALPPRLDLTGLEEPLDLSDQRAPPGWRVNWHWTSPRKDHEDRTTDPLPTYQADEEDTSQVKNLEQTIDGRRVVVVKYNPNPLGGINKLDDRWDTICPGLGVVRARCTSEAFTVAGPMFARVDVPAPSTDVTIFAYRMSILQAQTVTSPRDGKKIHTETLTPYATVGKVPRSKYPGPDVPSLWKGADTSDALGWSADIRELFPHSHNCRHSTLPGVPVPVVLTHRLVYDLYYSIYGEQLDGKKLAEPGPGQLRLLRRSTPIILPSCSILSQVVELPLYNPNRRSFDQDDYVSDAPCLACHRAPSHNLCTTCPPTLIPHVRHDKIGYCSVCSGRSLAPEGSPTNDRWICACNHWDEVKGKEPKEDVVEVASEQVERDGIFAVKLDGESASK